MQEPDHNGTKHSKTQLLPPKTLFPHVLYKVHHKAVKVFISKQMILSRDVLFNGSTFPYEGSGHNKVYELKVAVFPLCFVDNFCMELK